MVLIAINWLFLVSKYENPLKYVSIFPVGRIPLSMVTKSSVMIRNVNQYSFTSWKHIRTKVTPDLHLTYSKNGGNLGLVLNDKKWKFLQKIMCCGDLLESPCRGDSTR